MPLLRRSPRPALVPVASLTAASQRVLATDSKAERNAALNAWQLRALSYSETLGEVWYASLFYSRALRNLKLVAQERDGRGWKLTEDKGANDLLNTFVDANGEVSELLGMYGRHRFLTGEARLLGVLEYSIPTWEMLSIQEIHVNDQGQYIRRRSPISDPETYESAPAEMVSPEDGLAVMHRLWAPSARFSGLADSPMRAVLDICEELLLLTRSVRGEIRSRLAGAGLLLLPSELSLPYSANAERPDEDFTGDNIMDALTQAMETAIQNESAASALVPIILRGPGDVIEKAMQLSFVKPTSENEAKRNECIKRLALGLDLPPEILLGVMDANHWTAWQIDESAWKVHIQPVAQSLVQDITSCWFRPMLGTADYRIWYDESEVVNHPDRSGDFRDAHDRYVVSSDAYRKAIGAEIGDAMDAVEQERFAELKAVAHRGTEATVNPNTGASSPNEPPAATPGISSGGPTPKVIGPAPSSQPASDATPPSPAAARLYAAAEMTVLRCRELAGSRLRSKVDSAAYAKVHNPDLACALPSLPVEADTLVTGGGTLLGRALELWGVPTELSDQIVTAVELHAASTLTTNRDGLITWLPDDLVSLIELAALNGNPA